MQNQETEKTSASDAYDSGQNENDLEKRIGPTIKLMGILKTIVSGTNPKTSDVTNALRLSVNEGALLFKHQKSDIFHESRYTGDFDTVQLDKFIGGSDGKKLTGAPALVELLSAVEKIDSAIDEADPRKDTLNTIQGFLHSTLAELECSKPKEDRSTSVSANWLVKTCDVSLSKPPAAAPPVKP